MHLNDLCDAAHTNSQAKGFWDHHPGFAEKIALIHSELSEALEEAREGRMHAWHGPTGKPEGVPAELADVVIRVADLCGHLGIDLDAAVTEKLAYNSNRRRLHGKQF